MSGHDYLLRQLRHHYELLSRGSRGLTYEQAIFRFAPKRASIAWILSHMIYCADTVVEAVCGRKSTLSREYLAAGREPQWGIGSLELWKKRTEMWESISTRTLTDIEKLGPGALEEPPAVEVHEAFRETLTSRASFLAGHVFHVAYHLGQVGSLRAEFGLPWWTESSSPKGA